MNKTSSRFKDFESIVINDNQFEKCLTVTLLLDSINIQTVLSYLKCNGWSNYKFNQYSMKTQSNEHGTFTTAIIGYVPPSVNFK